MDDGDFIFIDAGTTTGYMIDFLPDKKITFVTNAFVHAKKLAQRGFKVYMPAGEIKLTTEAIVGAECVSSLQSYNFTKSFLGANGISLSGGITTPDRNEARVKSTVVLNSQTVYILADHSKFDQISAVTFAQLGRVKIITDKLQDKNILQKQISRRLCKMVYTVTFNPAIDYVVHTGEMKLGSTNRSDREEMYFGGKGINVSIVLRELDIQSKALGFTAGFTGEAIENGLAEMGIDTDFVHLKKVIPV